MNRRGSMPRSTRHGHYNTHMEITWQTALLLAMAPGVPGLIMLAIGIACLVYSQRKAAACTAMTTGYVSDYRFISNGDGDSNGIVPMVSYQVNGRVYQVMRKFRSVSSLTVSAPWLPPCEAQLWVTPDDVLHVKYKGSRIDFDTPARRLWPIGSPMPVYYNPAKPWQSYAQVKRSGGVGTVGVVFTTVGIMLVLFIAPMVFFLVQR